MSQQNAPDEAKPDEQELPQSRDICSLFFKGYQEKKKLQNL